MYHRILTAACILSAWATRAGAQAPIPAATVTAGTLSFDGRATVGDFTGVTTTVRGEMTGGSDLTEVRGWVEAPVATLETGNDKRDKDLNKSMESDKYPTIRFDLAGVRPVGVRGDTTFAALRGTFRIHGVEREAELPARILFRPDAIWLRSDFPLNLKDYEIGGLSKMFGMLKMFEDIVVHVELTFRSAGGGERGEATGGGRP